VGSLTSHNPIGLHSLLQDSLSFFLIYIVLFLKNQGRKDREGQGRKTKEEQRKKLRKSNSFMELSLS
jgi:hypothetical protein